MDNGLLITNILPKRQDRSRSDRDHVVFEGGDSGGGEKEQPSENSGPAEGKSAMGNGTTSR